MEAILKGTPEEIAALVLAVQGRQAEIEFISGELAQRIAKCFSSAHIHA